LQLYHLGLGTALDFGRAFALKGLAASSAKNHEIQAWPIMLRIWAMICQGWSGLPKNLLQGGRSMLDGFNCPDTRMILIAN
jgi:hypothetical protein